MDDPLPRLPPPCVDGSMDCVFETVMTTEHYTYEACTVCGRRRASWRMDDPQNSHLNKEWLKGRGKG